MTNIITVKEIAQAITIAKLTGIYDRSKVDAYELACRRLGIDHKLAQLLAWADECEHSNLQGWVEDVLD